MIYDFSDIPGLYAYFSATEGVSDTTGSVVNSTTSVSGSAHPLVLTSTGTNTVSILADQVGAMPGFYSTDGMSKNAILKHTFGEFQSTPNGYTMAVLYLVVQHTSFTHLCSMTNDTGSYGLRCSSGGTNWTITCYKTSTSPEAIPVPTATVSTHIISAGATSGNGKWYRDGVLDANAPLASGSNPGFAEIGLISRAHSPSTTSMDAAIAICAIYDRQIDDTEAADLHDLMAYWAANNEAPSAGPGPSATFGPVATNDDPSVTAWQWEESSDGVAWANVGTILTDVTGATTTSLTVNSAPIGADQTQVRCKATSEKEPAGVFSHAATLTVQ